VSPVRVTWRRTLVYSRRLYSTAIALAGFLAATVITFAFALAKAEGTALPLAAVYSAAVGPWLPVLAAILGMDAWSDERRTGRVALLLSTSVSEREFTIGKFLGVWTMLILALAGSLFVCVGTLAVHAPTAVRAASLPSFGAGFLMLVIQCGLWSAVAVAMSAFFSSAAAAAAATLAVLVGLPHVVRRVMMTWAVADRTILGIPPVEAHVLDIVSGSVSSATVVSYGVLTILSLFIASKVICSVRLVGRGARSARLGVGWSVFLAFLLSGLMIALAMRLDFSVEIPIGAGGIRFSPRTRGILADNREEVSVTCFLSRTDSRFRPTARFLRALARQAKELGGARLLVRYVDPNWDFAAAERLMRIGEKPGAVIFERGRRHVAIGLGSAPAERDCATAILSLVAPPSRRNVYWTSGHGEYDFTDYGPGGMSDIARELSRDGYSNHTISVERDKIIPRDCALVIVAGARNEFSRVELSSLESYLRQGGRLLVLMSSVECGGAAPLLPAWGLRPVTTFATGLPTLSGTDVIVSEFADHAITAPLVGSRIVVDRPVAFAASAAAENGTGVDRIDFTPLAVECGAAFAASVERGAGTGRDLALRPTRVVAIGDASFAVNASLQFRGCANRDFFLNSVAWLSGTDAAVSAGTDAQTLTTGMDRAAWFRFFSDGAVGAPLADFALLFLAAWYGRRRA